MLLLDRGDTGLWGRHVAPTRVHRLIYHAVRVATAQVLREPQAWVRRATRGGQVLLNFGRAVVLVFESRVVHLQLLLVI